VLAVAAAIFATGVAATVVAVTAVVLLLAVTCVATGRVGLLALIVAFVTTGVAKAVMVGVAADPLPHATSIVIANAHTNVVTGFFLISISN